MAEEGAPPTPAQPEPPAQPQPQPPPPSAPEHPEPHDPAPADAAPSALSAPPAAAAPPAAPEVPAVPAAQPAAEPKDEPPPAEDPKLAAKPPLPSEEILLGDYHFCRFCEGQPYEVNVSYLPIINNRVGNFPIVLKLEPKCNSNYICLHHWREDKKEYLEHYVQDEKTIVDETTVLLLASMLDKKITPETVPQTGGVSDENKELFGKYLTLRRQQIELAMGSVPAGVAVTSDLLCNACNAPALQMFDMSLFPPQFIQFLAWQRLVQIYSKLDAKNIATLNSLKREALKEADKVVKDAVRLVDENRDEARARPPGRRPRPARKAPRQGRAAARRRTPPASGPRSSTSRRRQSSSTSPSRRSSSGAGAPTTRSTSTSRRAWTRAASRTRTRSSAGTARDVRRRGQGPQRPQGRQRPEAPQQRRGPQKRDAPGDRRLRDEVLLSRGL